VDSSRATVSSIVDSTLIFLGYSPWLATICSLHVSLFDTKGKHTIQYSNKVRRDPSRRHGPVDFSRSIGSNHCFSLLQMHEVSSVPIWSYLSMGKPTTRWNLVANMFVKITGSVLTIDRTCLVCHVLSLSLCFFEGAKESALRYENILCVMLCPSMDPGSKGRQRTCIRWWGTLFTPQSIHEWQESVDIVRAIIPYYKHRDKSLRLKLCVCSVSVVLSLRPV